MMQKYCVHLGYAKCGSSFLQQTLFSGRHPEIGVLGSQEGEHKSYIKSGSDLFLKKWDGGREIAPFWFDENEARNRLNALTHGDKPIYAISNEELAGHPFSGGVYAETIARRIHSVVPDAKILLVFREQRKMLLSTFADFLERGGGRCSLYRFLNSPHKTQVPWHSPTFYCFSKLISFYRSQFGEENVLALPLEVLVDDENSGLTEIAEFLGVSCDLEDEDKTTRNARNYNRYAAIRSNPLINLFAGRRPTNGNAGFSVPVMRKLLLHSTAGLMPKFVEKALVARDLEAIENHLKPWVVPDNWELQKLVKSDLHSLGYML